MKHSQYEHGASTRQTSKSKNQRDVTRVAIHRVHIRIGIRIRVHVGLDAPPATGGVAAAPALAFVFEFLLPFGRPRGRLTGWPSGLRSSPGRFVPAAAFAASDCNRRAFRYLTDA